MQEKRKVKGSFDGIDENLDTYDWNEIRASLLTLIPKIVTISLETINIWKKL